MIDRGLGGSGAGASTCLGASATGAAFTASLTGFGGGGASSISGRAFETGSSTTTTFFLRGALSFAPAGRPPFLLGSGASVLGGSGLFFVLLLARAFLPQAQL